MNLLTRSAASKLDHAPTRAYLTKVAKDTPRPAYLVDTPDGLMVDTDADEWREMIERRANQKDRKVTQGKPYTYDGENAGKNSGEAFTGNKSKNYTKKPPRANFDTTDYGDLDELHEAAKRAKLMEPILKAEKIQFENEKKKVELERDAGNLIEYQLAEWLFLGYMERINVELLSLTKKISPMVDNLAHEKKPDEILKLFDKEFGVILTEVKEAQRRDLEKWKNENA